MHNLHAKLIQHFPQISYSLACSKLSKTMLVMQVSVQCTDTYLQPPPATPSYSPISYIYTYTLGTSSFQHAYHCVCTV